MSFRQRKTIAVNTEDLDVLEVPTLGEELPVLDSINALEEEVALVEANNEIENAQNDLEEGEELAEIADDEVAAGEEIIAEADAKAAETGEEPSIPIEEVVASQETLKTLIRLSGSEDIAVIGTNREAIYNDSYATYKQNLEGLKEIGGKIKENIKKIWDKIVAGFKWVVEQIKKILPTKLNRIKWLINNLNKSKGEGDLVEASKKFEEANKESSAAVATIVGPNLENVKDYATAITRSLTKAKDLLAKCKIDQMGDLIMIMPIDPTALLKQVNAFEDKFATKELRDAAAKDIADLGKDVSGHTLVSVTGKGTTLTGSFAVVIQNENTSKCKTVKASITVDKLSGVKFDKATTVRNLMSLVAGANFVAKEAESFKNATDKFVKGNVESNNPKNFIDGFVKKATFSAITKQFITANMSIVTAFDSSVLSYGLKYGKAVLSALNEKKTNEQSA